MPEGACQVTQSGKKMLTRVRPMTSDAGAAGSAPERECIQKAVTFSVGCVSGLVSGVFFRVQHGLGA